MKKECLIFDIDGTLSDIKHRKDHLTKKDWFKFFSLMEFDAVRVNVRNAFYNLYPPLPRILVTGRHERYRTVTEKWLKQHEICGYSDLYMRGDSDYRKDYEVKKDIYFEKIEPFYDVKIILEDRTGVVEMWRSLGLECWQVANGDY